MASSKYYGSHIKPTSCKYVINSWMRALISSSDNNILTSQEVVWYIYILLLDIIMYCVGAGGGVRRQTLPLIVAERKCRIFRVLDLCQSHCSSLPTHA